MNTTVGKWAQVQIDWLIILALRRRQLQANESKRSAPGSNFSVELPRRKNYLTGSLLRRPIRRLRNLNITFYNEKCCRGQRLSTQSRARVKISLH